MDWNFFGNDKKDTRSLSDKKATLVILQAHPTLLSKERNQPSFLLLISSLQCHLQT